MLHANSRPRGDLGRYCRGLLLGDATVKPRCRLYAHVRRLSDAARIELRGHATIDETIRSSAHDRQIGRTRGGGYQDGIGRSRMGRHE